MAWRRFKLDGSTGVSLILSQQLAFDEHVRATQTILMSLTL